ncbi:hypothetical protein [Nocardioides nanhaiensis]|uniref:DUF402 domain-containing protein n=1 Tax=Nocardioides nanhaiensis TaxID=1476871 RepID=A0ABP8WXU5_9ACTN
MRPEVKNRVTMAGEAVVAEISHEHDPHRTWLWLGPIDGVVELRRVRQSRDVDPEDWSQIDDDAQVVERRRFDDLDAALNELAGMGVDTMDFDATWKSSNPF